MRQFFLVLSEDCGYSITHKPSGRSVNNKYDALTFVEANELLTRLDNDDNPIARVTSRVRVDDNRIKGECLAWLETQLAEIAPHVKRRASR